jgi:hypothetical protein
VEKTYLLDTIKIQKKQKKNFLKEMDNGGLKLVILVSWNLMVP